MEPQKIEMPSPRKGRQQVVIRFEVNCDEYHSEVIVVPEEPVVSVEIRDFNE